MFTHLKVYFDLNCPICMYVYIYMWLCVCVYALFMQGNHVLQVRGIGHVPSPDERIIPYLRIARFYGISRIRRMMID